MKSRLVWLLVIPAIWACGFASSQPDLATIEESDLAGTWETNYAASYANVDESATETIVLYFDGTFTQSYSSAQVPQYTVYGNKWFLDSKKILHLEKGLWFPLGLDEALSTAANTVMSVEVRGERVLVNLQDEILLVADYDSNNDVTLAHLPIGDLDSLGTVYFQKLPETEVTASP